MQNYPQNTFVSHRIDSALGARHHQAWVQGVALRVFLRLSSLIHVRPYTLDLQGALIDGGVNTNGIVFSRLGGRGQTLDFPTFSIPERYIFK